MADLALGFIAKAVAYTTIAVSSGTTTVIDKAAPLVDKAAPLLDKAAPALLNGTAVVVNYTANTAIPAILNDTATVVDYVGNSTVPAILNGTAAVVDYIANSAVPAIRNSTASLALLGSGAIEVIKAVLCVVLGVAAVVCIALLLLSCIGFTSVGPAAGSFAASWMSSIAIGSGRVVAGSLYAVLQAVAMGGGCLLASPLLLAIGVVGGVLVWVSFFRA